MTSEIRKKPEGALLRTYLTAAGVSADSMEKPLIGVATSATQMFSEKPFARDLGGAVASGVEAAGGISVRWDTMRSPDLMAWGHAESYSFAWRDQLADLIESWARQQALDGLALVGDAPETLVGMAMAAARLNVPAIVVTAGSNRWEFHQNSDQSGQKKKHFSDPFELLSNVLFSKQKSRENHQISLFNECLLAQNNHASNAIDLAFEALGVSLPGMSTTPVQSPRRHELAYASGSRLVSLVKSGHSFRRVLSGNAFSNAIKLNAALGGSVDVAIHLAALAQEAGTHLSLEAFDRIALETPQICRLGGVGDKEAHRIEELDKAGGVWAILHAFKNRVLPTTTVAGKGAAELAKTSPIKDPHVINAHRPYRKQSGIRILQGNLASHGAICLLNQIAPALETFRGPAVIFEKEVEAAQAVGAGKVKKGSVLVVRGQGPRGGPALNKLRILPALMESRGLNKTMPLLTDGRLPDTPEGLFISALSPESKTMGALAILKDGDIIDIHVPNRQLMVRLTDTEMRVRLARWQSPETKSKRGFLDRYSRSVSEAYEGAVLK